MDKHLLSLKRLTTLPDSKPLLLHSAFQSAGPYLHQLYALKSTHSTTLQPFDNELTLDQPYLCKTLLYTVYDMAKRKPKDHFQLQWYGYAIKEMQIVGLSFFEEKAYILTRSGALFEIEKSTLMKESEFQDKILDYF